MREDVRCGIFAATVVTLLSLEGHLLSHWLGLWGALVGCVVGFGQGFLLLGPLSWWALKGKP